MTIESTSASNAVDAGIVAVVRADAAYMALLAGNKVHNGEAPPDADLDYLVIGEGSEGPRNTFMRSGSDGERLLRCWSADRSMVTVQTHYGHLRRLLDGRRLTVTGHSDVYGTLRYLTSFVEPGESGARCLVASYRVRSRAG